MSLQTTIAAALAPIAPTYPLTAPQGVTPPYITYFRVAGQDFETLASGGGAPRRRVQIDVWASTYLDACTLAAAAKDALRAALTISAVLDNPDHYEPDTRLFHVSFDIAAWE